MVLKIILAGIPTIGMDVPDLVNWMERVEKYVKQNDGEQMTLLFHEIWNDGFQKGKVKRYKGED